MKIALLTFSIGQNYGALLQAWALYRVLTDLGHDVKLMPYRHPWSTEPHWWNWRSYLARTPKRIWINTKRVFRQIILRNKFSKMEALYPRTSCSYGCDPDRFFKYPPKADVYVTGSDQAWKMGVSYYKYVRPFLLPFGDEDVVRIAYAVSTGGGGVPNELKDEVTSLLSRFSAISMREQDSADIISNLGFKNVSVMPDPTVVFGAAGFDELRKAAPSVDESECVYYVMNGISCEAEGAIREFANDGTRNIALQNFRLGDSRDFIPEVPQFVDAIARTKSVVTNSFHGTVFSLLYHKPFVYVKFTGEMERNNSRAHQLLADVGLLDRMAVIDDRSQIIDILQKKIEWGRVDTILEKLRVAAKNWLRASISGEGAR